MRKSTQYRRSPDGGECHAHFSGQEIPEGWTLHDGLVPGPDMEAAEIDAQVVREIVAEIAASPQWVARRKQIAEEKRLTRQEKTGEAVANG